MSYIGHAFSAAQKDQVQKSQPAHRVLSLVHNPDIFPTRYVTTIAAL
jgi:hypothetical protein